MSDEEGESIIIDEEQTEEEFEAISHSDEEAEAERKQISELGLSKDSDKAFVRLYDKSDQKEKKKEEKKPAPDFFLLK